MPTTSPRFRAVLLLLGVWLCLAGQAVAQDMIAQPLRQFGLGDLRAVAYSPDGTRIATCGGAGAFLWDASTGTVLRAFTGHPGDVTSVAFAPDGTRVLTGSRDYTARLWDANTGAELQVIFAN